MICQSHIPYFFFWNFLPDTNKMHVYFGEKINQFFPISQNCMIQAFKRCWWSTYDYWHKSVSAKRFCRMNVTARFQNHFDHIKLWLTVSCTFMHVFTLSGEVIRIQYWKTTSVQTTLIDSTASCSFRNIVSNVCFCPFSLLGCINSAHIVSSMQQLFSTCEIFFKW